MTCCLNVIMRMEKFFTTKETKEEMVDNHDNEFKEVGYFENDCQKQPLPFNVEYLIIMTFSHCWYFLVVGYF